MMNENQKRQKEEAMREAEHHAKHGTVDGSPGRMHGVYSGKEYPNMKPTEEMKEKERDAYWDMN